MSNIHKINLKKLIGTVGMVCFVAVLIFYGGSAKSNAIQNFSGWAWEADDNTGYSGGGGQQGGGGLPGGGGGSPGGGSPGGGSPADPTLMNPPGGLGWVSFNCITGGNCASADYGVDIDQATGNIEGYAWSPYYGWLKFGGLDGFPVGDGTTSANAKVNLASGQVTGWARFCAAADNPTTCKGTANINPLKTGLWDGWVSLHGNGYGITFNTTDGTFNTPGTMSGYAWGGDDGGRNLVGWLKFTNVSYSIGPAVNISANPKNVQAGGSTVISWIGENLISSSTGCQTSGSANTGIDWYGPTGNGTAKESPLGAFTTGPLQEGVYTYSIQCLGSDGVTLSNIASVEVIVGGVAMLNFFADPGTVYPPDFNTTLKWQTLNSTGPLKNCVAESAPPLNPIAIPNWDGPVSEAPVAPSFASETVPINFNPTNLKLTCEDTFGNPISSQISVLRGSLLESLTLKATAVVLGPNGEFVSNFSWSGINMDVGTCVGVNGGPNWPGPKSGPPGSQNDVIVPPTAPDFTTYSLKCTGKYSGDEYVAEIKLNEGSGGTFNTVKPKYTEN